MISSDHQDDTEVTERELDQVAIFFVIAAAIAFVVTAWTIYGVVRIALNAFGGGS